MDLHKIARNLKVDEQGIWTSDKNASISYPSDGNQICFELEDASFWFKHRNNCIASLMRQFPPEGIFFDLGGGNGYVSRRLLDEGHEVVLIEPGSVGAYNARKSRMIPNVVCSTLEDAGFAESSLDAVGCFDVVEHIEKDREFIGKLHYHLKPGGILYLAVPAYQFLWSASDVQVGHFRRYTEKTLRALLGAEFSILHFTYFFSTLIFPIFLMRTLPFRFGWTKDEELLQHDAEHGTKSSGLQFAARVLFDYELSWIQARRKIPFGGSCLLAARCVK